VLALSGKYDMSGFFGGYYDDNIYYNTPSHYVPNLSDHNQLEALRRHGHRHRRRVSTTPTSRTTVR
jgi:esterase/lipase superfamily enzyme